MRTRTAITALLLLFTISTRVHSQHTFALWSKHIEAVEQSAFNNAIFDGQDIIVNGYWYLSAEYDGLELPYSLSSNTLLFKMDLDGNILWHTTMLGDGYETFFDIELDSENNIIAVGWSSSNEPIVINGETIYIPDMEWTSRGVVAKFSGIDGSLIWYKPIIPNEQYYNLSINQVAIDANDNIYISGYGNVGFEIDGIEFPYTQEGWGSQTFLSKLNPDGEAVWGFNFNFDQEGDPGWSYPRGLAVNDQCLFLAFQYSKPVIVGDDLLPFEGTGDFDWIGLVKVSTETSQILGSNAYGSYKNQNIARLQFDNAGDLLATGFYTSPSNFNINGVEPIHYGFEDAYVAKFNDNLELLWLKGMGSNYVTRGFNLSVDNQNRIFVGGGFDSYTPFYFDGYEVIESESPNSLGMFQVILDENGELEKAFALNGEGIESRLDYRDLIALDNDQVIAVGASADHVEFTEKNIFYSLHDAGFVMHWDLSKALYRVSFDVIDQEGISIENATIALNSISNPANGYKFYQIEPGVYDYSVALEGYNPVEGEVEVVDQNVNIAVTLTPTNTSANSLKTNTISLFPNPSQTHFTIVSDLVIEEIEISDAIGRLIHFENPAITSITINVNDFSGGIYLAKIKTSKGISTRKIQVVK